MITSHALTTRGLLFEAGKVEKSMQLQMSLGVRDAAAILEKEHKTKVIKTGGGDPVRGTFVVRSNELRKSYHIGWRPGDTEAKYGSELRRARMMEDGGTIKPKRSTFLTIPTEHAPKDVPARSIEGLVYLQSLSGQPMLVLPTGDADFLVYFILRRQVKMPARPTLETAVRNSEGARKARMNEIPQRAIGGGNA